MEPLITVADVMERYKCSAQTARKYIRRCNPHMECPLGVYEKDFKAWEASRMRVTITREQFDRMETRITRVPRRKD